VDVLQTKFRVPPGRPERVGRRRLIRHLDRALIAKVNMISSPVGFGKTRGLSEWMRRVDRPSACASLGSDHDSRPRFLTSRLAGHVFVAFAAPCQLL
jgi:ATP/maltotriose-dependent transcriptional regulator MalT